ncbi:hypothetical protein L218DRAFT_283396 [Marasmius fiardii PR-910]|nr:hypothetical protein L218DRAFT_283396 [Marasmius fiardii PR-910]
MSLKHVKEEPRNDELDFMLSQISNSSDDHENAVLQKLLAEKLKASSEKKKKEHQKKFLGAIKKHIMKEITGSVEEFNATIQAIDELLQAFLVEHATQEDNIRKIWCEIVDEERKLQTFIGTCLSDNANASEAGERLRVKGMAKIRTVCEEHQRVIDFVKPA